MLFCDLFGQSDRMHSTLKWYAPWRNICLDLFRQSDYMHSTLKWCTPWCIMLFVTQALVEHFSGAGQPEAVERAVLHMDIASLDLNQVTASAHVY